MNITIRGSLAKSLQAPSSRWIFLIKLNLSNKILLLASLTSPFLSNLRNLLKLLKCSSRISRQSDRIRSMQSSVPVAVQTFIKASRWDSASRLARTKFKRLPIETGSCQGYRVLSSFLQFEINIFCNKFFMTHYWE